MSMQFKTHPYGIQNKAVIHKAMLQKINENQTEIRGTFIKHCNLTTGLAGFLHHEQMMTSESLFVYFLLLKLIQIYSSCNGILAPRLNHRVCLINANFLHVKKCWKRVEEVK